MSDKLLLMTDEGLLGVTIHPVEKDGVIDSFQVLFRAPITSIVIPADVIRKLATEANASVERHAPDFDWRKRIADALSPISEDEARAMIGIDLASGPDATATVFSRAECVWCYCPNPAGCQTACAHPLAGV